jgi:hypothetical protein
MTPLSCASCTRHLGTAKAFVGELICPNSKCKATTQFKILTTDETALMRFKFATPPKPPKSVTREEVIND